jgi:hypothetical protein
MHVEERDREPAKKTEGTLGEGRSKLVSPDWGGRRAGCHTEARLVPKQRPQDW